MKKATILSSLTVASAVLLVGSAVFAAELVGKETTTGTVKFTTDDGKGDIIEPDPTADPDVIIKMPGTEGISGSGAIRMQFIPNFRFGTHVGVSAAAAERPVELLSTQDDKGAPRAQKIAPFVQITDGRGLEADKSGWILSASATPFSDGNGHDLGNSTISLEGSTITTTMGDKAKAESMVEGQTRGAHISLEKATPTVIMKTKPGQSSNGYQVSNVFHDNYTKGMAYPAVPDATDSTNGVKFHKVDNVSPIKDVTYSSTITWTLTDGK